MGPSGSSSLSGKDYSPVPQPIFVVPTVPVWTRAQPPNTAPVAMHSEYGAVQFEHRAT